MFKKIWEVSKVPDDSNNSNERVLDNRGRWDHQREFFLSVLGYAIGYGNIWRFPYLCYKNGGAAFLIPYFIMLFLTGIPLFFLELSLGQYASLGPNVLFPTLSPLTGGIGWGMVMTSALCSIFYNVIFSWSLFYTFASFTTELPWGSYCYTFEENKACRNMSMYFYNHTCLSTEDFCELEGFYQFNSSHCISKTSEKIPVEQAVNRISAAEDYFRNHMLGIDGTDWSNMGNLRWEIVGCLALSWVIICLCLIKGIKSSGKVVYFTAIFPYCVIFILLIRGITLEGAYKGIEFYMLKPNLTKLGEVQVWADAASQIFFSTGVGFGGLITLASYNNFKTNCLRDTLIITFSNSFTSIMAGFAIFSVLGFLATSTGVEVSDVVSSGSGLVFIVYPTAISMMPYPPLWSLLFFIMFLTVGIDTQFGMVETVITATLDSLPNLRNHKSKVVIILSFLLFLSGLTLCLQGGAYMLELFNWYAATFSLIIFALIEVLTVAYLYGFNRFTRNIKEDMKVPMPRFFYYYFGCCWYFITPAILILVLVLSLVFFKFAHYGAYVFPSNIQALGWFMVISSVVFVPLSAIYKIFYKHKKTWSELRGPTDSFRPAHEMLIMDTVTLKNISTAENGTAKSNENPTYNQDEDNASKVEPRGISLDDSAFDDIGSRKI